MLILTSQCLLGTAFATDVSGFDAGKESPTTQKIYVNSDIIGSNGRFSNTDSIESKGKFVSTEMIASQDKKITCPVPPQKKKPQNKPLPKPEPVTKSGSPIITHVCSPIITINIPQGTYLHPSQSPSIRPTTEVSSSLVTSEPHTNPATPAEPTKAPENFKLKFKDLIETEITTHSPITLGAFILISLMLAIAAVYFIYVYIKPSSESKTKLLVSVLILILFATFVIYLFMKQPAPLKIEDTTIDRVYAEAMTEKASSIQAPDPTSSPTEQKTGTPQAEFAEIQAPRSTALDPTEELKKNDLTKTEWTLIFNILVLGISTSSLFIFMYVIATGKYLLTSQPFSRNLPLDELYKLEDEISKIVAATNNWFETTEVHLNSLIDSINHARKLLESNGTSKNLQKIRSVTFFVRADKHDYSYLNEKLRVLDEFLTTRSRRPGYEWRAEIFNQLTATRQDILKICEVRSYGEDTDIKVDSSK